MALTNAEVATLVTKLETLERQHRTLKRLGLVLLALMVVVLSVMAGRAAPTRASPGIDTIEVQRIVLTDKDGKDHGELTAKGGLPRVTLYDEKEGNKVFISPYFIELDTPLREISLDPTGFAIEMKGYGRMALDYNKLSFVDPDRKIRMALIPQSLSFNYQNSMPAANLVVGEFGSNLQLQDLHGQSAILGATTMIAGETNQRSTASLVLLDGQGRPIWKTPQ